MCLRSNDAQCPLQFPARKHMYARTQAHAHQLSTLSILQIPWLLSPGSLRISDCVFVPTQNFFLRYRQALFR